jgi:hypothetical protein
MWSFLLRLGALLAPVRYSLDGIGRGLFREVGTAEQGQDARELVVSFCKPLDRVRAAWVFGASRESGIA